MGWASEALFNDIHRAAIKSGMYSSGCLSISGGREEKNTSYYEEPKKVKEEVEEIIVDVNETFSLCLLDRELNPDLEIHQIEEEPEEEEEVNDNGGNEIMFKVVAEMKFGKNKHENNLGTFNVSVDGLFDIMGIGLWLDKETGEYSLSMPSKQTSKHRYFNIINLTSESLKVAILDACVEAYHKSTK